MKKKRPGVGDTEARFLMRKTRLWHGPKYMGVISALHGTVQIHALLADEEHSLHGVSLVREDVPRLIAALQMFVEAPQAEG